MECAICYEKFIMTETMTEKEQNKLENEIKNYSREEMMKFSNLLITKNRNLTHTCSTPNCECVICGDCWIKITHNGKCSDTCTDDDEPKFGDTFVCPYCRIIDWKDYMTTNVLLELQVKLLGNDVASEALARKWLNM